MTKTKDITYLHPKPNRNDVDKMIFNISDKIMDSIFEEASKIKDNDIEKTRFIVCVALNIIGNVGMQLKFHASEEMPMPDKICRINQIVNQEITDWFGRVYTEEVKKGMN